MNIPDEIILVGCLILGGLVAMYVMDLRFKCQQQEKRIEWLTELEAEYRRRWSDAQVELRRLKGDNYD